MRILDDLIPAKGGDKRVSIVGHIHFVPRVRQKSKTLWLIVVEWVAVSGDDDLPLTLNGRRSRRNKRRELSLFPVDVVRFMRYFRNYGNTEQRNLPDPLRILSSPGQPQEVDDHGLPRQAGDERRGAGRNDRCAAIDRQPAS